MYELVKVSENNYYIDCPAKIGVIKDGADSVYLIDSGSDKDAGRKVRQILDREGWKLKAILNTHSNADHVGGNQYLQAQTGCSIYAPGIEAAITRFPILEPSFLYGGYPCKALKNKFLMAKESKAEDISLCDLSSVAKIIPLPGHFFDMCGFLTQDGTAYIADCLASPTTLDKYGIPFIYDVGAYYDTLRAVSEIEAKYFVPAHADATDDITGLVRYNVQKLDEAVDIVLNAISAPCCFEYVLKSVFDTYGLTLSMQQYALVGSTVRSMLSWLSDNDRAEYYIEDNMLLWKRK